MSPRSKELALAGLGAFINTIGTPMAILVLGGWFFGVPAMDRHFAFMDRTEQVMRSLETNMERQTQILKEMRAERLGAATASK